MAVGFMNHPCMFDDNQTFPTVGHLDPYDQAFLESGSTMMIDSIHDDSLLSPWLAVNQAVNSP